ncbi:hypothetical protein QAD02_015546 [Eretmocerus hayati]|uniref:Uncharacterized protein n=1 Tax=Eretmocerus hayati TaxID=131215 RepID=A0ACC2PAZ4_9HYME|nr:hypothetical protein QAD02_015546 [Eretmocerus hayati]
MDDYYSYDLDFESYNDDVDDSIFLDLLEDSYPDYLDDEVALDLFQDEQDALAAELAASIDVLNLNDDAPEEAGDPIDLYHPSDDDFHDAPLYEYEEENTNTHYHDACCKCK